LERRRHRVKEQMPGNFVSKITKRKGKIENERPKVSWVYYKSVIDFRVLFFSMSSEEKANRSMLNEESAVRVKTKTPTQQILCTNNVGTVNTAAVFR
jgi:hypothetical protein